MLTYKKTRSTDKFQSYKIELAYGCLVFTLPLNDGDAKADRLLAYLNDNAITAWNTTANSIRMKLSMAGVEYMTGR